MAVIVKMEEKQKERLERFLAKLLLKRGKKISMQKVLGLMIDHALEDEEFVQRLEGLPPLEEDPAWKLLDKPKRTGIKDLSVDIDKWIYGE